MKRSILSVVILQALGMSAAVAAESEQSPSSFTDSLFDVGGRFGIFYENESKKVYNADGSLQGRNNYRENSLIDGFLSFRQVPLTVNYSIKQTENEWVPTEGAINIESKMRYALNARYRIPLGNGFGTGLGYRTEIDRGDRFSNNRKGERKKDQHQVNSWLSYWNNENKWGFYSQASYGWQEDYDSLPNNPTWQTKEMEYYKVQFKPYKNFGKFFAGVEFYYEDKDTHGGRGEYLENFTEKYVEPEIAYSTDFGGRLFIKYRYTEKRTRQSDFGGGNDYFAKVNKTTIGYQHNLKDWVFAAEAEFFDQKQDNHGTKFNSEEYDKIKLMAHYKF